MNIPDFLKYGVIGLGFLLAFLAYKLLNSEQKIEKPRRSILTSTYVFMVFSVVLCMIGFFSKPIISNPEIESNQPKN